MERTALPDTSTLHPTRKEDASVAINGNALQPGLWDYCNINSPTGFTPECFIFCSLMNRRCIAA